MAPTSSSVEIFRRRLNCLYSQWRDAKNSEGTPWEGLDALIIDIGNTSIDDSICSHKTALQVWLFQTEFPDSLMVFTSSCFYLLVSPKYSDYFQKFMDHYQMDQELSDTEAEGSKDQEASPSLQTVLSLKPEIKILYKDKADENGANFAMILNCLKLLWLKTDQLKLGLVRPSKQEKKTTAFVKSWKCALERDTNAQYFIKRDMAEAVVCLMGIKDDTELGLLRKSNLITNNIFNNFLREEIMKTVDGDMKVTHSALSENLEKCYTDEQYIPKHELKHVDVCYPPILQSGGKYSMRINHTSTEDLVDFGVITCSFGSVYKHYCSNVTRTFLVNPSQEIMENYRFLQSVEAEVMRLLIPGKLFSQVYASTLAYVQKQKPLLADKLHPNLGFSIGILYNKQPLVITPNSSVTAQKGMAIHVYVALCNLVNLSAPLDRPKQRNYTLMLGDTVLVNEFGSATMLTTLQQKLSWVSFVIETEPKIGNTAKPTGLLVETEEELLGRGLRKAVLESRFRNDNGITEKRQEHQRELMEKLNSNAERRVLSRGPLAIEQNSLATIDKEFLSYAKPSRFPEAPEIDALKIYVDPDYETIILPIFGVPIPFHIATLKNVSTSIEGDYIYFRINFLNPSTTLILEKKTTPAVFQNQQYQFLKELNFRSSRIRKPGMKYAPSENLLKSVRLVKEMHKKYKVKIAEFHESKNVCKQEALVPFDSTRRTVPSLKNIVVRPTVGNGDKLRRRSNSQTGVLEAHKNALRFRIKAEILDILYKNILCAVFQPCNMELGAYIHLVLRNEILISKKKYSHVQFYTEVGESITDLGKYHNCVDRGRDDGQGCERIEQEQKKSLNIRFRDFCDFIQSISEIEFEEPLRDLGFLGAPGQGRSSVLLQPTTSCLINITDWPPFVIMLEDIELIHFERVEFVLKTFDMVLIFKDYSRKVVVINAVPTHRIQKIKSWLDVCEIHYTEGPASLNWPKILKTITTDPAAFFETGGWTFLEEGDEDSPVNNPEAENEEEVFVSDAEYEPQTDESSTDYEDGQSTDYSCESSEESQAGSLSGSDASDMEGKSWDELERLAKAADNNLPLSLHKIDQTKRKYPNQAPTYYPHKKPKFTFSASGVSKPNANGAPKFKKTTRR